MFKNWLRSLIWPLNYYLVGGLFMRISFKSEASQTIFFIVVGIYMAIVTSFARSGDEQAKQGAILKEEEKNSKD